MLATPYCPQTRTEIFVQGTEPASVCPLHAGSGEPSPLWREGEMPPQTAQEGTPEQQPMPSTQQQRRREEQKRDRTIRGILRRIFGGGG
jgi:hypothetical protein